MLLNKKIRTYSITAILLLSVFSFLLVSPDTVKAESSNQTVLYFHDFLLDGTIDTVEPTKTNDSEWPPQKIRSDEWSEWAAYWLLTSQAEWGLSALLGDDDYNMSELALLFGDLMPSPLEITETYIYDGEDELKIKGNVDFDLYFSSRIVNKILSIIPEEYIKSDHVKVSLRAGSEKYNKTSKINLKLLQGETQKISVLIEDVDFELAPWDDITFSLEIIPGDKIISYLIQEYLPEEELIEHAENLADILANESEYPIAKQIASYVIDKFIPSLNGTMELAADAIYSVLDLKEEANMSLTNIMAEFCNASLSSSFIYDSVNHKSSVTLPVSLPGDDENLKTYYLHANSMMDESAPLSEVEEEIKLSNTDGKWDGPDLPRSKILTKATAYFYIHYWDLFRLFNLDKIKVTSTLLNGDEEIVSLTKELDKTTLLNIITKPSEPMAFAFEIPDDTEISYDDHLTLQLSTNGTKFGLLGLYSQIKLYYDSEQYPSSLSLIFDETDHIKINDISSEPADEKIVAGGSIVYKLNITSKYDDTIDIDYLESSLSNEEAQKWDIELPDDITISAGGQETVEIIVTSEEYSLDAYGDVLDITFVVSGKTGKAIHDAVVEISSDAVEHDVIITAPEEIKIKHGYNETYYFMVKNNNTGLWPDSYDIKIVSEHNFTVDLEYDEDKLKDLESDGKAQINVTVHVPKYTNISEDIIKFEVTSKESKESWMVNVTVIVTTPNILEKIFEFFENAAESLGFYEVFGDYAPHALAAILFILIFFVLILAVFLYKKKFIEIVCLDRIKEITTDEEAVYEITIKNPSNYSLNYELIAEETEPSAGWEVSLDTNSIVIESKQEQTIVLKVKPTDFAKPDDWVEVKLIANIPEKNKSSELATVTTLKDAKVDLEISGILHWPKKFKAGEVVKTSFKLKNSGNAAATNVTVVLYINGEEKNKVEGITIPRSGYADIEIPWVAIKGKNDIDIEVK